MTAALLKVASGFRLVYIGLSVVVLGIIVAAIGAAVVVGAAAGAAAQQGAQQNAAGAAGAVKGGMNGLVAVLIIAGGIIVIGTVLGLIGRFFCLAVPDEAGAAKPMIIASVVMEVGNLGITLLTTADGVGGNFLPMGVKSVAGGVSAICAIVAAILFLLFTRSVAEFVRRPELANKAMSVLWLWVTAACCYGIALGSMFLGVVAAGGGAGRNAGAAGGCLGAVLGLAALIIGLVALVKYANLLSEMSAAVRRRAEWGDVDEDDYDPDYDRPRRRKRRDADDDVDDDDDRPRRRKRRDDDDEDDYDDRGRRR